MGRTLATAACAIALATATAAAQTPQPFPRPGSQKVAPPQQPPPATPSAVAPPATAAGQNDLPTEATLGVQIYPGAEFLASFDAGKGQRYYLFGTNTPFADIVNTPVINVIRTTDRVVFRFILTSL